MLSTRNVETLRLQWMAARYKERVGERIKAAREARNWSQARLAREMPGTLDGASISRWETGKVEPRADNLQALLVPEPEPGTGDLMGALGDSQLDRIEAKLDELLSRLPAEELAEVLEREAARLAAQRARTGAKSKRNPRSGKVS